MELSEEPMEKGATQIEANAPGMLGSGGSWEASQGPLFSPLPAICLCILKEAVFSENGTQESLKRLRIRAGVVAHLVGCLPSTQEALGSIPSMT